MQKVLSLDKLESELFMARDDAKIVHCHGTFDLLHVGHIKHLQVAKLQGDLLVVTITADKFVSKGPGRPVFNESIRADALSALQCVDYVSIVEDVTALPAIDVIRPAVYVKGSDYKTAKDDISGNILLEKELVESHGGRIFFTDEITFSSSKLLNEYFDVFSKETKEYLSLMKSKYSLDELFSMIDSLSSLKVLVVGDAIIDEYHTTVPLGQTGKGNILSVKYESSERFAGGAMAVANHAADFVGSISLVTGLGKEVSFEQYIRDSINPKIEPYFFYRDDGQTLVKRRFVDQEMDKLFEVYFYNDQIFPSGVVNDVVGWLEEELSGYDVVIVPDFGNGFVHQEIANVLSRKANFLAVNAQINSGNRGHHAVTRYEKADFISINEPELRLATHDRIENIDDLALKVARRMKARGIAITRGTKGALVVDAKDGAFNYVPALSTKVVDRIGAGDAFLTVASLAAVANIPADVTGLLGSAAAAISVQTVCNSEPVSVVAIKKYITTLLK